MSQRDNLADSLTTSPTTHHHVQMNDMPQSEQMASVQEARRLGPRLGPPYIARYAWPALLMTCKTHPCLVL